MANRKQLITPFLLILLVIVLIPAESALAFRYEHHEESGFWWFVQSEPDFELVIPSTAGGYLERDAFGEKTLDMYFGQTGPKILIGSVVSGNVTVEKIRMMVINRHDHIFTTRNVEADRQITTGSGQTAHFYAATSSNPSGRSAMVRLVIFQEGRQFAYLLLTCYADEYRNSESLRTMWLTAVNTFTWL